MINSLLERKIDKRPDQVRLQGRILFLTEDPELIKRQLAGEDLPWDTKHPANNPKLRDDISTDEITPAHYCFYFDETLGEIPYLGLKCGSVFPIGRSDVKKGGFVCAVSGKRRGKGSSREQSPYAEMCAGIRVVIAETVSYTHLQRGHFGKGATLAQFLETTELGDVKAGVSYFSLFIEMQCDFGVPLDAGHRVDHDVSSVLRHRS